MFFPVSPGSGSWRSGLHRQGTNSEEDGLKRVGGGALHSASLKDTGRLHLYCTVHVI